MLHGLSDKRRKKTQFICAGEQTEGETNLDNLDLCFFPRLHSKEGEKEGGTPSIKLREF